MSPSSLQVVPSSLQALTPQQLQFNTLMQQITQQRELLAEWEAAIAQFHQRYMAEIVPLQQQDLALKEQLLRLFDRLSDQKLAKADQAHLAMRICRYVEQVLASEHNAAKIAELRAIFQRHANMHDSQVPNTQPRVVKQQADCEQNNGDEPESPEAELEKLAEQYQREADEQEAMRHSAAEARAKDKARRQAAQQAARAQKPGEADKQASQSVREVYRRLVSSLHPDREADPTERERKTALMQRVNQAYAAGHLLQLLELQLEIEQINPQHMNNLSQERLKHYSQVLNGQLREIKQEVKEVQARFKASFGIAPSEKLAPKKLRPMLAAEVAARKHNAMVLGMQLKVFSQGPGEFKDWLKEDRRFYQGLE